VVVKIDAAIVKTREFFESLGIKTHLSDYGIGEESTLVKFEVDDNGKVLRMWNTVNYSLKVH
jgi:alcohol dehydrogenase YqhD (iron-dependent ADH family)